MLFFANLLRFILLSKDFHLPPRRF